MRCPRVGVCLCPCTCFNVKRRDGLLATHPSAAPLTELLPPALEELEGDVMQSRANSPNLARLWKQLLNARTHLDPGLTAQLDVNYSLDVLFFLTPQRELLPVALRRCCWRHFSRGSGVINADCLFSHTVGQICVVKSRVIPLKWHIS